MDNRWFNLKEQGAGEKRLWISLFLYRILGAFPLRIIAFFVASGIFCTAKTRRVAAEKYFCVLNDYTGKKFCPIYSAWKLFLNYANALVDRIISFSGKMKGEKFVFADSWEREKLYETMKAGKGVFFLTTHVGNVEILRSFLFSDSFVRPKNVNIFLQPDICKTFNKFLKKAEVKTDIEIFSVDDIDLNTSCELNRKLQEGEISFIAGDRIAANNVNKTYSANFLGRTVELPLGALRFAMLMEAPVFLIVCAKAGDKYKIHTQEVTLVNLSRKEKLERLKLEYCSFLEKYTLEYPHEFYNFFDIFED